MNNTDLNTSFLITGGAGRVVSCIPALEKYHRLNPEDDFKVLIGAWGSLLWSHPLLQDRVVDPDQKDLYDHYVKNYNLVSPEPYHLHGFYNQQLSLAEAFDKLINNTNDHSDLTKANLYLTEFEIENAKGFIEKIKDETGKSKVIVFQPFGSGVKFINRKPIDSSNRSFTVENYLDLVNNITEDAIILYASEFKFKHPSDNKTIAFDGFGPYHRSLMSFIYNCDLFVGCCSVGQHIARAFDKKGILLYGATNEKSFSYPDHFGIFRKAGVEPKFSPWRIAGLDSEMADRHNDNIMNFDQEDILSIAGLINKELYNETNSNV